MVGLILHDQQREQFDASEALKSVGPASAHIWKRWIEEGSEGEAAARERWALAGR